MKKILILLPLFLFLSVNMFAQSSMSDEQVAQYVMEQHEKGTSSTQIVTQLMQRGVNIEQIRRVKKKYEAQQSSGMDAKDLTGTSKYSKSRIRSSNEKTKSSTVSQYRKQDEKQSNYIHTYDTNDAEYEQMQKELATILPDSLENNEKSGKKVFGRDIFNQKNLSFEPNMNIATPQNYRLGPGDAVNIDIWGASQNTFAETISPDGTVQIEGYGPIQLNGLTVRQANSRIRSQLGTRYQNSKIQLTVGQTRTIMVNVMGEVKTPGTYTLSAFATVFHALYMAGGTNDIGTLRNIKVYRHNRLITVVDVYDYILNGKLTGDVRLADNDVIVVGPYDCLVNVTGKVKRPMYYEMRKNESLGTVLRYAGSFTGDAYKKSIRVVRKSGHGYSVYNVGEFDLNTFRIDDEDSVSVDSVLRRYSNMVEIKGAVFRPGMYQVGGEITSVRSLIEHAEGVTEDAFVDHAVMHRMKSDRTLEALSVDVKGIMSGKVPDILLRNEDVLYIPSKKEVREDQTMTIHGEVVYPGVYQYAENETLEDFVLQAGGLKEAASTVKVDVARRISDPKATTSTAEVAKTFSFSLKDGFVIDGEQGFKLMPYDEVYVRTSPAYSAQQNIKVEGEVLFSGTYTLSKKSERLSEIIQKAGGVSNMAYIKGARLERTITPEERLRMESVLKMAQAQSGEKDSVNIKKLDIGSTYYVGIHLDKALENPGSDYDIVLREGDNIIVPQYTGTVKVNGEVMYPNTVAYRQGKHLSYYVDQSGGYSSSAKKSHTYIIYMNGTVAKAGHDAKPEPGCEIVVPAKPKRSGMSLPEILTIGTSTASIATMIATIANLIK
jgi:protein involved in polysaccharide export with SLBB domain